MSSSPTEPTSTTASSNNSPSPAEASAPRGIGLIACGALAVHAARVRDAHGWDLTIHPLNPLLHNAPQAIPGEVERLVAQVSSRHTKVVIGYADCGTYGALDEVCARLGLQRLPGLHCYDLYAGPSRIEALLAEQPGTYLLTDFLVKSFSRTVIHELGLDRFPQLRDDYFRHYTRIVWLAQDPEDAELAALARRAAARVNLPLEVIATRWSGLERALAELVSED